MPSVLITGSNRGIGLEWARQLAAEGWRVYATCRHPADAHNLEALASQFVDVVVLRLDVTVPDDVHAVYQALRGQPLDLLINNAGVFLEKGGPYLGALRFDDWLRTLAVNTLGPVRVTEALLENLERGQRKQIVVTTSHMGSIGDINYPGDYYYRSSKAALNAAFKGLAVELKPKGINVSILHPGAVATRMGGPESDLTPEESVRAMRRLIDRLPLAESGEFYRYNEVKLPW
jgi:NAD(P)-dependent dehydrogenase (short-subunit alcohol dehydrogenase family)